MEFETAMDQAKVDETLGDMDVSYIVACIYEQLNNLYSSTSKINYIKVLKKDMEKLPTEMVEDALKSVYPAIIDTISNHFEFDVDTTEYPIEKMANTFYKFFVCNYIENVTMFLESVIIEKQKEIVEGLKDSENTNDNYIPGIPTNICLIMNNLHQTINIIAGMDIDFREFLRYVNMHDNAKSSVEKMMMYEDNVMDKTDSIVPNIFKYLIEEGDGFGDIFIEIERYMYARYAEE